MESLRGRENPAFGFGPRNLQGPAFHLFSVPWLSEESQIPWFAKLAQQVLLAMRDGGGKTGLQQQLHSAEDTCDENAFSGGTKSLA